MTATRPPLRGQGYMKKGGAVATSAYNDRVRSVEPVSSPVLPVMGAEGRTRASAGVPWLLIACSATAGFGVGSTSTLVWSWLLG